MSQTTLPRRSLPPRLRTGVACLALLAALSLAGPLVSPDPKAILDPPAAALLPPGSARIVVELADGSSLAATSVTLTHDGYVVERRGESERLPADRVRSVTKRRFILGTDTVGRDVLARLLWGGRVSLTVGCLALVLALVLGVLIGLVAGTAGGIVDALAMRAVDALLAIPILFLLLLLAALYRPSLAVLVLVLGASSWMGVARLVRGQVVSLVSRDFILAARGIGAGPSRIALRHLLPNAATPVAQDAALRLGDLILVEAALSFLGLGVQPPVPSWGTMVAEGQTVLTSGWWLTFAPGLAVALTVIATALVADGLGEVLRGERSS